VSISDFNGPDRVSAEVIRLRGRAFIDQRTLDSHVAVTSFMDHTVGRMVVDMEVKLAALGAESVDVEREWAADWWQAVRARWAPAWWLRRHPVRMERVSIHRRVYAAVCPHMLIDDQRNHFEFMWLNRKPVGIVRAAAHQPPPAREA
jgi:hypothetical protein